MFKVEPPHRTDGESAHRASLWSNLASAAEPAHAEPALVPQSLAPSSDMAIASPASRAAPFAHYADAPSRVSSRKRGHDALLDEAGPAGLATGPADGPAAKRSKGPAAAPSATAAESSASASAAMAQAVVASPLAPAPAVLSPPHLGPQSYHLGQHGAKTSEQKRLTDAHQFRVSGATHQSEHPIGFEPLNQTSGERRSASTRARNLENRAPAYQEVYQPHRSHIGTGTHGQADDSGMNSEQYRTTQRSLLEAGQAGAAVQINQLGYAFDPGFVSADAKHRAAARDSFGTMVHAMDSVTYAQNDQWATVPVSRVEKLEMLGARWAAENRQWPTHDVLNNYRAQLGLPLHDHAVADADVEMADASPKAASHSG